MCLCYGKCPKNGKTIVLKLEQTYSNASVLRLLVEFALRRLQYTVVSSKFKKY